MLFRPLYPYTLLLGLGLLGACNQSQRPPATAPAAPPDSLAAAAITPAAPPVPVLPPDSPAAAPPRSVGPLRFPVRPMAILDTIGTVRLGREAAELGLLEEATPLLRLLIEGELPRLFYRAHPRDTTWLELELEPDLTTYEGGQGAPLLEVEQADLDGRGRPEVLLRFSSEMQGIGHATRYTHCYLLDLTPPRPRLLLRALTAKVLESSWTYAAMHGDTLADDEVSIGYERALRLRGRDVRIGAVSPIGRVRSVEDEFPLTPLRVGRYRYQGRELRYVGP